MFMKKIISVILIILLTKSSFSQQVYTFNGNGKWSDSTNWQDKKMPPIVLDSGSQILIDPIANGECLLDTLQLLRRGSIITIQSGKKLNMSENLVVNPEQKGLGCGLSDLDSLLSVPVLDTSLLPRLSHKMPSALSLPLLDVNLPPVIFQGTQGSCTAFAVAYATRSYYLHQDHCTLYSKNGSKDLSKILSPAFCYNTGKVSASCNADLPLFTALSKMQTSGVCTWERMPYYDYDCSMLPDEATKKNASIYKIDGFNKIKDISQNYIKRTLNGGKLIMAAISVDEGFYCEESEALERGYWGLRTRRFRSSRKFEVF